jgi:DNA-binding MarR family transcriptional regulator
MFVCSLRQIQAELVVTVSTHRSFIVHRKALHMALPQQYRLSSLQLAILRALHADLRRHPGTTAGIPYFHVVQAIKADKASITTGLRQLLRKGLVSLTLPPGSWTRHVMLTEEGQAYVKTLQNAESRAPARVDAYEMIELARQERRWQGLEARRERRRDRPQRHEGRRAPRRGE